MPVGQQRLDTMDSVADRGDAVFSAAHTYRYSLDRSWGEQNFDGVGTLWVMLNPSTADARRDDPTLRKVIGFTKRFGDSRLRVVNLYGFVATKPADLFRTENPVGPENDAHIALAAGAATRIVLAWGAEPPHPERVRTVLAILRRNGGAQPLYCLGRTRGGDPRHPVRLAYATELEVFYG